MEPIENANVGLSIFSWRNYWVADTNMFVNASYLKIYQWTPHGRRRRERPQQSWKNQVTDSKRSRNLEEDMAENRRL